MQSYLHLRLVLVTVADVCVLCSSLRRAEQEKKLAQQKKEEEERLRKEEADKKAKEAEEKRKRLEEAEKKRQAMMQAQKEKQQAAGQGAKGTVKKADSGVSTTILHRIAFVPMQNIEAVTGILCQKGPIFSSIWPLRD